MGFVLGPILRRVDISVRREIVRRLTPRTLFLMPTISIISGTTGWFLAVQLGYAALHWPEYGWVAATLILKRFPSDLNRWNSQAVKDEQVFVH